jgi:hypothetical protein
MSLVMNQINEIKKYISHYLQIIEVINEKELKEPTIRVKGKLC